MVDHDIDIHQSDWNKTPLTLELKVYKGGGPTVVWSNVNYIDRNKQKLIIAVFKMKQLTVAHN